MGDNLPVREPLGGHHLPSLHHTVEVHRVLEPWGPALLYKELAGRDRQENSKRLLCGARQLLHGHWLALRADLLIAVPDPGRACPVLACEYSLRRVYLVVTRAVAEIVSSPVTGIRMVTQAGVLASETNDFFHDIPPFPASLAVRTYGRSLFARSYSLAIRFWIPCGVGRWAGARHGYLLLTKPSKNYSRI